MVVNEPKRLPPDPPFGPITPPADWSDVVCDFKHSFDPIVDKGTPLFYGEFSVHEVASAKALLSSKLSLWLERAEDDLLFICGSKEGPKHRGQTQKVIYVDLINTFRCSRGSQSIMAKIQRWIQSKFLDAAGAVRAWRDTTGYPASLKCFRRVSALVRATLKNGNVGFA